MRILLVEDDAMIRTVLAEHLADDGFDVCEADNGDAAASMIAHQPQAFELLITDLNVPGSRDGIEVARLMRTRFPRVPVIFITGRSYALLDEGARLGDVVLEKPFSLDRLTRTAKRLIGIRH